MKKNLKRRRAVSPVVSALLMVTITVAAFTMIYAATDSWIRAQKRGALLMIKERVVIEDVWFMSNNTGKYICIYIRNIGKVEIGLYAGSLKINDATPSKVSFSSETLVVGVGGWINASFSWTVGTTYKISVLTERGSEFVVYATA